MIIDDDYFFPKVANDTDVETNQKKNTEKYPAVHPVVHFKQEEWELNIKR